MLAPRRTATFVLAALAWSLGLFVLLRTPWVEAGLVLPLTQLQKQVADYYAGSPAVPVAVTLECSGTDALALCLATILACPVGWRARLTAALGGIALVLALNTLRIATLGRAAASPVLFNALHLQIWPALLVLAIGGYVLVWMRAALRSASPTVVGDSQTNALAQLVRRFAPWAALLMVAFALSGPWIACNRTLLATGVGTAHVAAFLLSLVGLTATASGNVLTTGRGAFMVTPDCLATALFPLYVAGVLTAHLTWVVRALALLAAAPLFTALAIVRLLLLALPPALAASPLILVHGFHQLVLAASLVLMLALWREAKAPRRWAQAAGRAGVAVFVATLLALLAGTWLTSAVVGAARVAASLAPHTLTELTAPGDAQGALALMPGFQAGLLLAFAIVFRAGWRGLLAAFGLLFVFQIGLLVGLGELTEHVGVVAPAMLLRAWAVGVPSGLALALLRTPSAAETLRVPLDTGAADAPAGLSTTYRRFWHDVGAHFPDLGGATSTAYYLENEQRLVSEHLPNLERCVVLKTDLWDEVKNTRILQWVSAQGATVFGVDISEPIVQQARAVFGTTALHAPVADVRRLPFRDRSFDAVYSMGTIEHFRDPETALREMHRVLRPGGRAVVGVPNRFDPFLRPLLAKGLQWVGLYGYGYERSFSRRALRRMLESAGFEVVAETAILFIPGWLRMADLALHCHFPRLAPVTAALVRPFVWLDRHVRGVRRHGYLLASVAVRRTP